MVSVVLETSYKLQKKKKQQLSSGVLIFMTETVFFPAGQSLRHFLISVIYLQKHLILFYKKYPPFAFKHFCIRSSIESTNFMHNSLSMLSHSSSSRSIGTVLEKTVFQAHFFSKINHNISIGFKLRFFGT